ncbi:MAG: hypothetical protein EOP49_07570 [Sphingobacteriales bacterium]|nr:MAG: hypothetical protein EOP49_07570 [Sphingobacteriales bacterium]
MHNTVKHAKATSVLVQINCHPEMLSILVEDNGQGMDPGKEGGSGLAGIEKRIHSLAGHFNITSSRNEGTSVYIELELQSLRHSNALV